MVLKNALINQKATYYSIMLTNLDSILANYLGYLQTNPNGFLYSFDKDKECIFEFEKLRTDYLLKLKHQDKGLSLTTEQIGNLNIIFTKLRFILTKIGRILNYYECIDQSFHKKKRNSVFFKGS